MDRYKVLTGSQSAHCCFEATVVDTHRKCEFGDGTKYEILCECLDYASALAIADAMNR